MCCKSSGPIHSICSCVCIRPTRSTHMLVCAVLCILSWRQKKSEALWSCEKRDAHSCLFSNGIKLACDHAQVLQKICWFVVLAATSSDQLTLLNTTAADKKLEALPAYKELLQTFITQEASTHILPVNRSNSSCLHLRFIPA